MEFWEFWVILALSIFGSVQKDLRLYDGQKGISTDQREANEACVAR